MFLKPIEIQPITSNNLTTTDQFPLSYWSSEYRLANSAISDIQPTTYPGIKGIKYDLYRRGFLGERREKINSTNPQEFNQAVVQAGTFLGMWGKNSFFEDCLSDKENRIIDNSTIAGLAVTLKYIQPDANQTDDFLDACIETSSEEDKYKLLFETPYFDTTKQTRLQRKIASERLKYFGTHQIPQEQLPKVFDYRCYDLFQLESAPNLGPRLMDYDDLKHLAILHDRYYTSSLSDGNNPSGATDRSQFSISIDLSQEARNLADELSKHSGIDYIDLSDRFYTEFIQQKYYKLAKMSWNIGLKDTAVNLMFDKLTGNLALHNLLVEEFSQSSDLSGSLNDYFDRFDPIRHSHNSSFISLAETVTDDGDVQFMSKLLCSNLVNTVDGYLATESFVPNSIVFDYFQQRWPSVYRTHTEQLLLRYKSQANVINCIVRAGLANHEQETAVDHLRYADELATIIQRHRLVIDPSLSTELQFRQNLLRLPIY